MKTVLSLSRLLVAFVVTLLVFLYPTFSSAQAKSAPARAGIGASLAAVFSQGERQCIQPPQHLNPKTLSDAQLALYGLPDHRTLESSQAFWSADLAHYHHRVCGSTPTTGRYNFTRANRYWGGNEAISNRGTYRAAQISFKIPRISGTLGDSVGDTVSFWAGVGGDCLNVTNPCEVVQAGLRITVGNNGFQSNKGWWEYFSPAGPSVSEQDFNGLPLFPGDTVTVFVSSNDNNDGQDFFQVCTSHNGGTCASHPVNGNFSDSATGECIGERPAIDSAGDQAPLANFGTEEMNTCEIGSTALGGVFPIGTLPHNFHYITDDGLPPPNGNTLEDVGPISGLDSFPLIWRAPF